MIYPFIRASIFNNDWRTKGQSLSDWQKDWLLAMSYKKADRGRNEDWSKVKTNSFRLITLLVLYLLVEMVGLALIGLSLILIHRHEWGACALTAFGLWLVVMIPVALRAESKRYWF